MATGMIPKPIKEYTFPWKIALGTKVVNFGGTSRALLFTNADAAALVGKTSVSTTNTVIYGDNGDYNASTRVLIGISITNGNYYAELNGTANNYRVNYMILTPA